MAKSIPVVAIIGRANVGKSSLFNRLLGRQHAITHEQAGTTRDSVTGLANWGRHNFWLVDTAGLKTVENQLETSIRDQIEQAASSADVIVVVADASGMPTTEDLQAAKLALKLGRPVVLALNKIDRAKHPDDFSRLGISETVAVSAIHGTGTGELLDLITKLIKPVEAPEPTALRVAILGRPNVGKSSLLNCLVNKQHAIVSDVAGTTRDINTAAVKYHGRDIELSDTAGLRRRGRITPGVEKFSTLRTIAAIAHNDIALLVIDATEPSVAGDQHIAGMVEEAGKGLVLVVNKWDAVAKDEHTQAAFLTKLGADFQFAWWAPVIFVSAETGLNAAKLLQLVTEIDQRRHTQVPTASLNRTIQALTAKHPPAGLKRRQPKVKYATQTGIEPPTFAVFTSHPEVIHFSWKRYLENGLRNAYDFTGTPINIIYRDKRGQP